jgi:hypothetical protein
VEIIWGDEDNDKTLSLKYIKYKDRVMYDINSSTSKRIENDLAIVKDSRLQAAEVWNTTNGAPDRVKTHTDATVSKILSEDDSSIEAGMPITLKRAEILPQRNFILDVNPAEYLLNIYKYLPEREIVAIYETRLTVLSSSDRWLQSVTSYCH